jgi:hypothetical protein
MAVTETILVDGAPVGQEEQALAAALAPQQLERLSHPRPHLGAAGKIGKPLDGGQYGSAVPGLGER